MIAIVDYGAGNLRSVAKALAWLGVPSTVTSEPAPVREASAVILPGQGAAGNAMARLHALGLVEPLHQTMAVGKPFLGVCLGLQLLLSWSEEDGGCPCLDVLPGRVRRLPAGLKVPHMGWNQVHLRGPHPLLEGVPQDAFFYFVHSYYGAPEEPEVVAGETEYGIVFCSLLIHDNVMATQFHPEKSGEAGLRLYENFCRLAGEPVRPLRSLGKAQ